MAFIIAQVFNILVTLGIAYLVFGGVLFCQTINLKKGKAGQSLFLSHINYRVIYPRTNSFPTSLFYPLFSNLCGCYNLSHLNSFFRKVPSLISAIYHSRL